MDGDQEMSFWEFLKHAAGWAGIGYLFGSRGFDLVEWAAFGTIIESVSGFSAADFAQELQRELHKKEKQDREAKDENRIITPELQFPSLDMPGLVISKAPKTQVLMYSKWREVIKHPSIVLVFGGRGTGKSAVSYRVLEDFRYSLSPYVVGFPEKSKGLLPDWIGIEQRLEDVPSKSIIIVDEAYISHHAREWQKTGNRAICRLLNLSRQQDKTIVFIAQQGRQLDIDIVSSADVLVLKNPGMLQPKFDRPEFRDILLDAKQAFQSVKGDIRRWNYVYSQKANFAGLIENDLPTFWSTRLSKAYANLGEMALPKLPKNMTDEEKMQKAKELYAKGWSQSKIAKYLGVAKSTVFNWIHDYPYRKQNLSI